jgi:hypothetical protein
MDYLPCWFPTIHRFLFTCLPLSTSISNRKFHKSSNCIYFVSVYIFRACKQFLEDSRILRSTWRMTDEGIFWKVPMLRVWGSGNSLALLLSLDFSFYSLWIPLLTSSPSGLKIPFWWTRFGAQSMRCFSWALRSVLSPWASSTLWLAWLRHLRHCTLIPADSGLPQLGGVTTCTVLSCWCEHLCSLISLYSC